MKRHLATLSLLLGMGCGAPPQPAPVTASAPAGEAKAAADDRKAAAPADAETAETVEMQELAPGVEMPKKLPNGIPLLTPMDFALCMIPAKDLTTTEARRQRGYARRKLVMNNPDSPTARVLTDLTEAAKNGEIAPPSFEQVGGNASTKDSGIVFSVPGTTPQAGRPPAGYRPPAGSETKPETKPESKSEEPPAQ